jgi:sugar phosphate isomerase/epimerase
VSGFEHIADLPKTELLRIIVALSTEVYALADRMRAIEEILAARGVDLAALDAPTEPAAFDERRKRVRDEFVERVFGSLAGAG